MNLLLTQKNMPLVCYRVPDLQANFDNFDGYRYDTVF